MNDHINMSGWKEYWELFDKLCDSLLARSANKLVTQLDDARVYVKNNYTSALSFLKTFNALITKNQDRLTQAEKKMANTLSASLRNALDLMTG
jgi:hypothetical protein